MKNRCYLGVDVGSVSTNLVLLGDDGEVLHAIYRRTEGAPIAAVQAGMRELGEAASGMVESLGVEGQGSDAAKNSTRKGGLQRLKTQDARPNTLEVAGVGVTGSARQLTGVMVGADVVKNEITAHAVGACHAVPEVRTVFEIGGQDSKIIILREGVVVDFAMNSICAAGTGSFLDQQAARLKIPIEEFGTYALRSNSPVRIAGRCGVFAESDMVHKQQLGHSKEDIIAGLCEALVRNYLNNVGRGKEILPPVVFQGGVAANAGIKAAFEKALGCEVTVPPHFNVMGAVGAALLAQDYARYNGQSNFKGFAIANLNYRASSFICNDCSNQCEVVRIHQDEQILAMWGDRCSKWMQSVGTRQGGK